MRNHTIAVIGGSGFIGSFVIKKLVERGCAVKVATRRRERARHLTMLPIDVLETDVHDPARLAAFIAGADAVINLAGVLQSHRGTPYGPEFARLHVELPRRIAAACRAKGVRRILHMSALGAASNGPSMYQRSKGDGEKVMLEQPDLAVTIFRPSVVFGPGDHFLNMFATLLRTFPVIPLAGATARFQPIFVRDVADAFGNTLDLDRAVGKTYELGGPTVYTLEELVRLVGRIISKQRRIIALPDALARVQAGVFEMLPGEPMLSRDNLDSMKVPNVMSGPLDPDLGIQPASIAAVAPDYLTGQTGRGRNTAFRNADGRDA